MFRVIHTKLRNGTLNFVPSNSKYSFFLNRIIKYDSILSKIIKNYDTQLIKWQK
uniref:Uncharacterized protein n=1 Tax=Lepeophtheirus salmonis TaxID=72036 RepID=A0A0K2TCE2_LEPSM